MKTVLPLLVLLLNTLSAFADSTPWNHGPLQVSDNGAYLQHSDGAPFFLLANTGWLLPQKSTTDDVITFLDHTQAAEYNVVMVQTLNAVPSTNAYGQKSHTDGWEFNNIGSTDMHGYWDHMDFIINEAQKRGIYIGMVCIWGGLVKNGLMDAEQAVAYSEFLAARYKRCPNIIWIIGGDIRGDVKPEVWEALASTIKANDPDHLMTFHPFGRTSSAYWWHESPWLDFNLFQSGHRRYDQTRGDGDDRASAAVAEDNWRYAEDAISHSPRKPVIDGEPSYEDIPQGLHDVSEPRWQAADVRRYGYWSVFAGAAGHTYGHNSIMQMYREGDTPAYGADKPWTVALNDPGFLQMKYLKRLMGDFPYHKAQPDQGVIASTNGERYDRATALRGDDFILVYTYTNQPMLIDLSKISGLTKNVWWYHPSTGEYEYAGAFTDGTYHFQHSGDSGPGIDYVLVIKTSK